MQNSLSRPIIEKGNHPIETGDYITDTLSIHTLEEKMMNWTLKKTPGVIIYGNPRLGKSCAIKYLIRKFESDSELDVKVYKFNTPSSMKINENEFFTVLGKSLGLDLYDKGKAIDKRIRIYNALKFAGLSSSRKQILLFVDEAQRLQPQHYDWLMDIFNELDEFDIKLTTILVGQKELTSRKNSFMAASQTQIVLRFMVHECPYEGINSIESLWYLLKEFDEGLEMPINSGWTYSRYYFPIGFANGWRLSSKENVKMVWSILSQVHKKAKTDVEVPMYYMVRFISEVFMKYGYDGEGDEIPSMLHWSEVIFSEDYLVYLEAIKSRRR